MTAERILIVCSGNICRSPMAEVVLRHLGRQAGLDLAVDSAGTGGWHAGEPMDPRAAAALAAAGYDATGHLARRVEQQWLAERDLVLAADRGHLRDLRQRAGGLTSAPPIRLLGEGLDGPGASAPDVPDPYYGSANDFASCLELIERCCAGLVAQRTTARRR